MKLLLLLIAVAAAELQHDIEGDIVKLADTGDACPPTPDAEFELTSQAMVALAKRLYVIERYNGTSTVFGSYTFGECRDDEFEPTHKFIVRSDSREWRVSETSYKKQTESFILFKVPVDQTWYGAYGIPDAATLDTIPVQANGMRTVPTLAAELLFFNVSQHQRILVIDSHRTDVDFLEQIRTNQLRVPEHDQYGHERYGMPSEIQSLVTKTPTVVTATESVVQVKAAFDRVRQRRRRLHKLYVGDGLTNLYIENLQSVFAIGHLGLVHSTPQTEPARRVDAKLVAAAGGEVIEFSNEIVWV